MKLFSVKHMFNLFLVICFAYGVWEARDYSFLAKVFPYYVSMILLVFAIINFIWELRKSYKASEVKCDKCTSDLSSDWDIPMETVWLRFGFYLGMILLLYAAIYIIGYPLSMTLFICLFYRFIAKASIPASIIAGAAGLGFMALMSHVLGMDWPEGLIKLPWPLG